MLGLEIGRVTLIVFSISILVLAGFSANEKVYAGGGNGECVADYDCAGENTIISVNIIGDPVIYLDSENKMIRVKVVIENFDPAGDGYYFVKVTNSSGYVVKETEIFPMNKGNQIWGTEFAHIITTQVPGTFQILIYTEFGTATATATVSLLETNPNVEESVKEEADQSSNQTATIQNPSNPVDISVAAPLKQVAQGVLPNEIICKEGLELIIKNNGSPACVKPKTAEILIERGWANS